MSKQISQYPSTFYRVSLKAVITNDKNEVLVCKEYESDTWSLPGGGWDHGETEHEALARELKEEVDYRDSFTAKPIATNIFWLESKKAWLLWIVYDVQTKTMNFGIGEECNEVAFINAQDLINYKSRSEQWIYENL